MSTPIPDTPKEGTSPMTSKKIVDPFDVEALRAAPPTTDVTEHVVLNVTARRPNRSEFFRVHPDAAYRVDATVVNYEGDNGREIYFVPPAMRPHVPIEESLPVRLFTCVNRNGVVFLWPARLPTEGSNTGRSWHTSALSIAEMAETSWVKMFGNRNAGAYEAQRATGDLGVPVWSDEPLGSLLRKAFSGEFLINSPDHDVLRKLRGEI